jgi:hypothetical protein
VALRTVTNFASVADRHIYDRTGPRAGCKVRHKKREKKKPTLRHIGSQLQLRDYPCFGQFQST